jgi:hypothetical protein
VFERVLHRVIQEGLDTLNGSDAYLRRVLASPGYVDDELADLVTYWKGEGQPRIVHSYARANAQLPCFAIVLAGEHEDADYVGNSKDATSIEAVEGFIRDVEAELGRAVSAQVMRFQFTYQIFTYAANPDVVLAYHNVLRAILLGASAKLAREGVETPTFSGMDLAPNQQYLPENVFARMMQVVGYAHLLTATDFDLGPWATGRYSHIDGIYVANAVVGVDPRVTPVVE